MAQTVFLHLPAPLEPLQLQLEQQATLEQLPLPHSLASTSTYFRTRASSRPLDPCTRLSALRHASSDSHPIDLVLGVRLLGGKGGFGSQLRAAGGRMSAGKSSNMDACRDLSGRRLSTIKEAQRQAELLESTPDLRAAVVAADKAKLEAIERSLGLSSADGDNNGEGSSNGKRLADVDLEELARKKHKFDDNTFFEESREIKDNVRSAVAAGLLKKKKKAKPENTTGAQSDAVAKSSTPSDKSKPAKGAAVAAAAAATTSPATGSRGSRGSKSNAAMPPPPVKAVKA